MSHQQFSPKVRLLENIFRSMPGLQVLQNYERKDLVPDILAGLVIVLVLIPSTLAYADLAGSSPVGGIYAALTGTFAYFLFTKSRHVNVGPDGAVALLAGTTILPLTGGNPEEGVIVGAWLALFTGLILILAAKLQLGAVASFLSVPVLLGYLNGAAVVIIVSQAEKLFGIELGEDSFFLQLFEWSQKISDTHLPTLAVGVSVLGLLFLCKRLVPRLPPLVPVFLLAMAGSLVLDFEGMGIAVIGEIADRTPHAVGLSLDLNDVARLGIGALGLSMLIFPEGLLLGRAMADKHNYKIEPDREIFALGACNIASGAFQGFSVGGSQTRTLLNSATGGRTQVANLMSAVFLILFMLIAVQWIGYLPKVVIAAILTFTGLGLIDVKGVRRMFARHRQTAWVALGTSAAVVVIGVLPGILMGTTLSIAILLKDIARPEDALLGRVPDSDDFHDVGDDESAEFIPGLVIYRFYSPLNFANVSFFIERLQGFIDLQETPVRQVILDANAIPSIDFTAVETLRPFLKRLEDRGIEMVLTNTRLPLRQSQLATDLHNQIPQERVFATLKDAVAAYLALKDLSKE